MNAKATQTKSKISDITNSASTATFNTKVTETESNRLEKTSFDARMKEETKSYVSKSQMDAALHIADKNIIK